MPKKKKFAAGAVRTSPPLVYSAAPSLPTYISLPRSLTRTAYNPSPLPSSPVPPSLHILPPPPFLSPLPSTHFPPLFPPISLPLSPHPRPFPSSVSLSPRLSSCEPTTLPPPAPGQSLHTAEPSRWESACLATNRADTGYAQWLVATRLLDHLHDPVGQLSRLQRIHPRAL